MQSKVPTHHYQSSALSHLLVLPVFQTAGCTGPLDSVVGDTAISMVQAPEGVCYGEDIWGRREMDASKWTGAHYAGGHKDTPPHTTSTEDHLHPVLIHTPTCAPLHQTMGRCPASHPEWELPSTSAPWRTAPFPPHYDSR